MRKSGISVEFQKKTFDSFATKGNAQLANAKEKAVRYVECFANKEHDRHNLWSICTACVLPPTSVNFTQEHAHFIHSDHPSFHSQDGLPTEALFAEYVRLYPNVDVKQQFNVMRSWCLSNPKKRKTKRGITRFVNSWLTREQDKGYRRPADNGSYKQRQSVQQISRFSSSSP